MKRILQVVFILTIINLGRSSVVTLKDKKSPKMVRNLSKVIYEDLSSKLTHLMNKRAEIYPEARNLNNEQIDVMKNSLRDLPFNSMSDLTREAIYQYLLKHQVDMDGQGHISPNQTSLLDAFDK